MLGGEAGFPGLEAGVEFGFGVADGGFGGGDAFAAGALGGGEFRAAFDEVIGEVLFGAFHGEGAFAFQLGAAGGPRGLGGIPFAGETGMFLLEITSGRGDPTPDRGPGG